MFFLFLSTIFNTVIVVSIYWMQYFVKHFIYSFIFDSNSNSMKYDEGDKAQRLIDFLKVTFHSP